MSEGERRPKWIQFMVAAPRPGTLTRRWEVLSTGGVLLGEIRWWNSWRCYVFFHGDSTLFEPTCLRDIASFLEVQTGGRRRLRAEEKARGLS